MPLIRGWAADKSKIDGDRRTSVTGMITTRRMVAGVGLAAVVLTALIFVGDAKAIASALRGFEWWLSFPIVGLTLWNYAWRFVKWELYLRRLAVPPLQLRTSLLVFCSAFSMSLTPGKIGELIKSVYLRRLTGAPISRTSAIIAAERITDALAMFLLALVGLLSFSVGRLFLAILGCAVLAGLLALQRPAAFAWLLNRMRPWPGVGRFIDHGLDFLTASVDLLRGPMLVRAVGLGLISWMGECLAFYFVLVGLGVDGSWNLLVVATFVLALSSLAGGASMLPGGLGVAEASVAGMLLLLINDDAMSRSVAAAATILIRLATLWFAMGLGLAAVAMLERRAVWEADTLQSGAPAGSPTSRD